MSDVEQIDSALTTSNRKEKLRVLLVEDSELDMVLLLRHLQANGYQTQHRRVASEPEIPEPGLVHAARYAYYFWRARWQRRGAIRQLGGSLVMPAYNFGRPRRVYAGEQIPCAVRGARDPQVVFTPQLRTHQGERGFGLRPHLRRRKVRIDFVGERFQSGRSAG